MHFKYAEHLYVTPARRERVSGLHIIITNSLIYIGKFDQFQKQTFTNFLNKYDTCVIECRM